MKNNTIISIGKYTALTSFIVGNICLLGYIFTKNEAFAVGGLYWLLIAGIINSIILISLFAYGFYSRKDQKDCFNAIGVLLINVPVAILYTWIGIASIVN